MKRPVSEIVSRLEGYDGRGFEVLSVVQNENGTYTVVVKENKEENKNG